MAVKKINWNLTENYTFKPVDSISVINRKVETTQSAWGLDNNLVMPTTKFWLYYKLTNLDKISTVNGRFPFFYSTSSISGSFNKIIFPSLNPENFLTQSLNSVVYYLDVYNSVNYEFHKQGEDLGWSRNATRKGFKMYSASYIYALHIMAPFLLQNHLTSGDTRGNINTYEV